MKNKKLRTEKQINNPPTKKVIKVMLQEAAQNKPQLFVCYALSLIVELLGKVQIILLPKFIIDELVMVYNGEDISAHLRNAIFYVALVLFIQLFANILRAIVNRVKDLCNEWFDEYFQVKVNAKSMSVDFECTEDPAALDQLNKAKEGMTWYSGNVCGILDQFFWIINNSVILIFVTAVLFRTSPWIILVQLATGLIVSLFNKKIKEIELKGFQNLSKSNRIFGYLFFQIANFELAKDIRLYNSSNLFNQKGKERLDEQMKTWIWEAEGSKKQQYAINFFEAISNGIIYFYIGLRTVKNLITIGDFSMGISAASNFSQSCQSIINSYQEILKRTNYANEYVKFMEYPDRISKGTKQILQNADHVIEFKNVSFKYPRTENFILRNVNLTIPCGQHLAVVGLNGAGKTTFIKLLCRLYDVNEGEILIDGINIKEYSDEEYRKLFAVLFQDFKLFAFSLRENITFEKNASESEIDDVLKLSGLYDDVQKLSKKTETMLWKSFDEEGIELSGGQKQKTAIARVLYKNAPIVIMDEPTAALDPLAEAEIYEDFNKMVGGKTAIYISHRLSSCKFCDKIAVFSENVIKEYGTHDELMKIPNGVYNTMFTTQAKQYRKGE